MSTKKFNPKLIMIDVDGTLVDSVPDLAFCVDETMKAMGRDTWGESQVLHWVGNGVPKLVERSLTGELEGTVDKADFDKAYPIFLELYSKNTSVRSCLYDGVKEGLDYMKAQGYTLGCVTNKAEQFTLPILKDLGIFDYFGIVVSGDTLAKKKPDPLPLLHSAEFFGIDPKDSLMLGDSVSDVKASRAAGFNIICMSYGYNHGNDIRDTNPDLVIDSMAELKNYL
ncbi:Phosphoglycolate phosphatase (EC 3.1.3.18) [uncultured Gammaproteobacteria bacterium]|uniref:phosphoglycolate phosphatase n=1 Tax=Bathymodiolus heckerae thiotrophic gill symbiont TaxID=1052212 RepID=UPI0010B09F67|nr:phosphoglycolate phosphatase [Bathymodiolus heckerae thiotrophic gill symbiont]CAC9584751.1 Phosphoglycolate phosphatase (EC 3.1.3.18) [uncultured Gammaproteobacteria bacterium]CAC9953495.1 Phosphoglycolate phosphatase (EC 3.1.3.18) [uncultured Gammaproteobacteria bacterium]SHN91276.1 Phosphoglycolate phosphatase [Bathymodiolus heckerae thiotrophic gill symbiont]